MEWREVSSSINRGKRREKRRGLRGEEEEKILH